MENRQQIIGELTEISPFLAERMAASPYRVPAGYFDALAVAIWQKIQAETVLPTVKNNAYQVPQGYFEGLSNNILTKIKAGAGNEVEAELAELAPLLHSIPKQTPYVLPVGYFEQLVPARAIPVKKKAKVISLARKWTQYAAAAVVAGILVTTAFLVTDNTDTLHGNYRGLDVPAELDKVSENELATYLDNPESAQALNVNGGELQDIHTISDDELNQFLKENTEADLFVPASVN